MKPIVIKIIIRALATLGAMLGLAMIFFAIVLHLPSAIKSGSGFGIGFSVFSVLFGVYLSGVAFFTWFGLSPVAVRHVLGTLAFILFGMLARTFDRSPATDSSLVSTISVLLVALLFYALYRGSISYCCNRLFPVSPGDVKS